MVPTGLGLALTPWRGLLWAVQMPFPYSGSHRGSLESGSSIQACICHKLGLQRMPDMHRSPGPARDLQSPTLLGYRSPLRSGGTRRRRARSCHSAVPSPWAGSCTAPCPGHRCHAGTPPGSTGKVCSWGIRRSLGHTGCRCVPQNSRGTGTAPLGCSCCPLHPGNRRSKL